MAWLLRELIFELRVNIMKGKNISIVRLHTISNMSILDTKKS